MRIAIEVKYGINTEWSVEFTNLNGNMLRHSGDIELTEVRKMDSIIDMSNLLSKSHDLAQNILDVQKSVDALEGEDL